MTLSEANRLKLQHKEIPHDVSFYDQDGHEVHYIIRHEDEKKYLTTTFLPSITNKIMQERLSDLKTMEMSITLKITGTITKC